jgi:hypothetical protein
MRARFIAAMRSYTEVNRDSSGVSTLPARIGFKLTYILQVNTACTSRSGWALNLDFLLGVSRPFAFACVAAF